MLVRRFVKKGIYVGDGISFYLVWYGIVRFFVEQIRTDAQMLGNTGIRLVVVYSTIMIIAGIVWFIVRRVKKISMITVYDALYGFDSNIFLDSKEIEKKKNKKKTAVQTEE
jgi:phosphatidylglycerol:prolipoprotein diacylglycerol transferase